MKHKRNDPRVARNDPMCNPWDSQGDQKLQFLFLLLLCLDFFIRNENISSEECRTKNCLK